MITRTLLLLGAVLVFGTVNWQIASKERLRTGGETVYLELAPVDPRSLMQGDYMALNFDVARGIAAALRTEADGQQSAILQLDSRRVGRFVRIDTGGTLNSGEVRINFRMRSGQVWLGTNAFFFQEGDAERYRSARFGEFHLNERGEAMLVGLRNAGLQMMVLR